VILYLLWLLLAGLVLGALARLALPGKDPLTLWQTMLVGLGGVFGAGLIYWVLTGGQARGAGLLASFSVSFAIMYVIRRSRGGDLTHPDSRRP
jgi:uncharacterized membrane protein YeaQ/YmgE (transglycosylase-associated protein family)